MGSVTSGTLNSIASLQVKYGMIL